MSWARKLSIATVFLLMSVAYAIAQSSPGFVQGHVLPANTTGGNLGLNDAFMTKQDYPTQFSAIINKPTTLAGYGITSPLTIGEGGTGAATAAAALNNLLPTPTRAGDLVYWNGSAWVDIAGNNSGTNCLTENASGVPSWGTCGGGGVTSVSNSDGTLTISPTTGAVVASLALAHANTWAGVQTFNNGDFALVDASAAHNVFIQPNSSSALTADRILTIDVVDAARTLKLGANLTLATDPGAVTGALKSNGTGTFATAACSDLSNGGTACSKNTGTSGATVPLLNAANTWSAVQTFNNGDLALVDASAAHNVLIQPNSSVALAADRILTIDMVNAARTLKLGANLTLATDPGTVTGALKSNGSGTFAAAACGDLSDDGTACTASTGTSGHNLPFLDGANTWSAAQTITPTQAANTSADGLALDDTTAASAGNQQYSPRLRLTGRGWKTDATAASQTVDWIIENLPVQGTANPSSKLVFSSQINGGGYTANGFWTSSNHLVIGTSDSCSTATPCISTVAETLSAWTLGQSGGNFQFVWNYNATPANAFGQIATNSYGNPIYIDASVLNLGVLHNNTIVTGTGLFTHGGSVAFNGSSSGAVTAATQAAAGTWNWNWPTTAGLAGQYLASQAGGSTAMTWATPAYVLVKLTGVNFNSANTDNAVTVPLPAGNTRWRLQQGVISNASHTLTTATFGMFSSTGGGGTVIVTSGTAITVSATTDNTNNNLQIITPVNNTTESFNFSTIQFRVQTAEGAASTADLTFIFQTF